MRLSIDDLGHRFADDGPWLFRNVSACLEVGEVLAVTGPSGSGKSTLLKILVGWSAAAEGSVGRIGLPHVSWVFQNPHGTGRRTVLDHVALPFLAQGVSVVEAEEYAAELLDQFSLSHVAKSEFRRLSGGEGQRLMLARAVASRPSLILIDEPTAQLDQVTARQVDHAIMQLADRETIVVVATHDMRTRDACSAHIDLGNFQCTGAIE